MLKKKVDNDLLSVPFHVGTRRKSHHHYETDSQASIEQFEMQRDNRKLFISTKNIVKNRIIQEFVGRGRVAMAALIKWIQMIKRSVLVSRVETVINSIESDETLSSGENNLFNDVSESLQKNKKNVRSAQKNVNNSVYNTVQNVHNNVHSNVHNEVNIVEDCEPLADALMCEPVPYRSAVEDGATHVIVLRTRPDPCAVLGKGPGVFEHLIAKRYRFYVTFIFLFFIICRYQLILVRILIILTSIFTR